MLFDIKAVIFDMDGLLLDTERVALECFSDTAHTFGLPDAKEGYLRCVGLTGTAADECLKISLGDNADLVSFRRTWRELQEERLATCVPLRPKAAEFVSFLRNKSVPMGVATSTETTRAHELLGSAGLLEHLPVVIGKDLVQNHKPDPEVYHLTAHQLGVEATACVAFEDSEVGTRAAIASGAVTIQITDLVPPSMPLREMGHIIASDFFEGASRAGLFR